MANVDSPFGLRPVMMLDGSPWNGQTIECQLRAADSTATFIGDLVVLDGTAGTAKCPTVAQADTGGNFFGVIVGFEYDPDDLTSIYRLASTQRKCKVVPALDVLFEAQEDGAGTPLALNDIGDGRDIVVGSGSTTTGFSGMEINSDGTANDDLMIMGLVDREDNEVGVNAKWLVRINVSALRGSGTGV